MTPEQLNEIETFCRDVTEAYPQGFDRMLNCIDKFCKIVPSLIETVRERDKRIKSLTDTFQDHLVVNNSNRARIAELEEARAWQPIETAPESEAILLWSPFGSCFIAPWPIPNVSLHREQIVAMALRSGSLPHKGYAPTHWMPLPAPPTE